MPPHNATGGCAVTHIRSPPPGRRRARALVAPVRGAVVRACRRHRQSRIAGPQIQAATASSRCSQPCRRAPGPNHSRGMPRLRIARDDNRDWTAGVPGCWWLAFGPGIIGPGIRTVTVRRQPAGGRLIALLLSATGARRVRHFGRSLELTPIPGHLILDVVPEEGGPDGSSSEVSAGVPAGGGGVGACLGSLDHRGGAQPRHQARHVGELGHRGP